MQIQPDNNDKRASFVKTKGPFLSVVILAYNEEENLPVQVTACLEWFDALKNRAADFLPGKWGEAGMALPVGEILVVDDGSTDSTGAVARDLAAGHPEVRVVQHRVNLGMGAAVRSGYQAAIGRYVTQLPADCQISPLTLEGFLPALHRVDLVLSVYRQRGDGVSRSLMSRGFQSIVRALYGADPRFTGTMVLKRSLLSRFPIRSNTFFANLELPFRLVGAGVAYEVVEIQPVPRRSGASKVANPKRIAHVVGELLDIRFRHWS